MGGRKISGEGLEGRWKVFSGPLEYIHGTRVTDINKH